MCVRASKRQTGGKRKVNHITRPYKGVQGLLLYGGGKEEVE